MKVKTIINLMKNIRWKTIFGRFRIIIILCFIIPVIILDIIIAAIYSGKIKNEVENNLNTAYLRTSISVEEQFKQVNDAFNLIVHDGKTTSFLTSDIKNLSGREASSVGIGIADLIRNATSSNSIIDTIGVYSKSSDYLISNGSSGYIEKLNPRWYTQYLKTGKSEIIFSDDEKITICHGINYEENLIGMMVFELSKKEIIQKLKLEDYKLDIGIILTDIENNMIFRTGNTDRGIKSQRIYELGNESLYMIFTEGNNTEPIYKAAILYFLIYFITSVIIVVILAFFCSMLLYDSIADILAKIDVSDENAGNIKKMNRTVLETVNKEENIEDKIAQSINALHSAQLSALQMQLNPHFIFNVLNYANSVILKITKCDNDAIRIIVLLCSILQFAMEEPKYETTVGREMEIAEEYIEIERLKTGIDFQTIWEVDEDIKNEICLKLFLQPIIENSVMHGFKRARERQSVLKISAKKERDFIIFTVEDNGRGMTAEKLEKIRCQLDAPFEDFTKHIGIRNVGQRIKLVYGNECGMEIYSDENGTRVIMKLGLNK